MPAKAKDLSGQKFNRLTVIDRAPNRGTQSMWNCVCDCGTHKQVSGSPLRSGGTKSCGCFFREQMLIRNTTMKPAKKHDRSKTPEYYSYHQMKGRCYRKSNNKYHRYGARGITICDRWLGKSGFNNFFADMGAKPSPKHSIDRIDNDGNYSPENCRWATPKQQMNNMSTNRPITFNGITMNRCQWADHLNIKRSTLDKRLTVYGWSIEKALTHTSSNKD